MPAGGSVGHPGYPGAQRQRRALRLPRPPHGGAPAGAVGDGRWVAPTRHYGARPYRLAPSPSTVHSSGPHDRPPPDADRSVGCRAARGCGAPPVRAGCLCVPPSSLGWHAARGCTRRPVCTSAVSPRLCVGPRARAAWHGSEGSTSGHASVAEGEGGGGHTTTTLGRQWHRWVATHSQERGDAERSTSYVAVEQRCVQSGCRAA